MIRLMLIWLIGVLTISTAYSQESPILPDTKIDSFYCFGPAKTLQLVREHYRVVQCDTDQTECMSAGDVLQHIIVDQDSSYSALQSFTSACEAQRTAAAQQIAALNTQLKMANGIIRTTRIKDGILYGTGATLLVSTIFLSIRESLHK
jgi:hypothetical protein